jgi:hypothetical protein
MKRTVARSPLCVLCSVTRGGPAARGPRPGGPTAARPHLPPSRCAGLRRDVAAGAVGTSSRREPGAVLMPDRPVVEER